MLKVFINRCFHASTATLLNIGGLIIGITAFILILQEVYYEYSFDRFHPYSERTFRVEMDAGDGGYSTAGLRWPEAQQLDSLSPHIKVAFLIAGGGLKNNIVYSDERAGRHLFAGKVVPVTPGFFEAIRFKMTEGSSGALDGSSTAIIPRFMAKNMFGNASAVGKVIQSVDIFNRIQIIEIVGVYEDLPSNTIFRNDIYTGWDPANGGDLFLVLDSPASQGNVLGVVRSTVRSYFDNPAYRLNLISDIYFNGVDHGASEVPQGNKVTTYLFITVALLIILIAAINFINFTISQLSSGIKGINTRKILGCPLPVLRLKIIFDSVILVFVAFFMALFLVYCINKIGGVTYLEAPGVFADNMLFYFFAGGIVVSLGVISGTYPAFYATSFPMALVIKGAFTLSTNGRKLRVLLIGVQFTISMVLIIVAVFMNIQYQLMRDKDLGFEKDQLLQVKISYPLFYKRAALSEELRRHPGIKEIALSSIPLLQEGSMFNGNHLRINYLAVTSPFVKTLGLELVDGSDFTLLDDAKSEYTRAILNQTAQKELGVEVGDVISDSIKVVGIVKDFNFESLHHTIQPLAIFNLGTDFSSLGYVYLRVNTTDYQSVMKHIRNSTQKIDPNSLCEASFFDDALNYRYLKESKQTKLITFFSYIAILLSLIGVFGLVLFETTCRKKEIGVRRVMGATVQEVLLMFNRSYVRIVLVCFVLAAPVAYYATKQWLNSFAYKTPMYFWVFLLALFVVLLITILTVTFQSYRAATENPVDSIKTE